MANDRVLWRVGEAHAALVSALALVLALLGYPLRGVLLGGGLIGLAFVTFWMIARSITNPRRRGLAILLGVIKVALYLTFGAAVLAGRVVVDAEGFALGVTCFLLATLAGSLARASAGTSEEAGA